MLVLGQEQPDGSAGLSGQSRTQSGLPQHVQAWCELHCIKTDYPRTSPFRCSLYCVFVAGFLEKN